MSFLVYFSRKCTSSNRNRRQMNCFLKCFASQQIYGHNKTYIAYKKLAPMLHTPGNVHFLFIFIHIDTNRGKMHLQKCETNSNKFKQIEWKKKAERKKVICWNGFYIICATPENYHFFVGVVITVAIAILPPKYLVPMIKCSHVNNNRFIALTSRSLCIFDFISFSPRLSFGVDKPITSTFFTLCLTCQF